MKSEVYRWRLSGEIKSDLEREARLRKVSVSSILDMAVREWLRKGRLDVAGDKTQRELHKIRGKVHGRAGGPQLLPRRDGARSDSRAAEAAPGSMARDSQLSAGRSPGTQEDR